MYTSTSSDVCYGIQHTLTHVVCIDSMLVTHGMIHYYTMSSNGVCINILTYVHVECLVHVWYMYMLLHTIQYMH